MLATSTVLRSPPKPGWQTDELEDEWIEPFSSNSDENISIVNSLSITSQGRFDDVAPKDPMLSPAPPSPTTPGTFLIREDQLAAPILPKPLLKGKSKGLLKDFFSPLALETMFEPPSPMQNEMRPAPSPPLPLDNTVPVDNELQEQEVELATVDGSVDEGLGVCNMEEETRSVSATGRGNNEGGDQEPFKGEDVILASDIPNLVSFDGRKPSTSYKFTFSAACPRAANRMPNSSPLPVKDKFQAPPTDPRLRLFQFQYDTFTRDHLSAMVDSIAVHTPSDSSKPDSPDNVLSGGHAHRRPPSAQEAPNTHLRATKRLKLTPPEDNDNAFGSKTRKDYVGESKSLMKMIKQPRTPSMTTTVSAKENIKPTNTENYGTVEDRPRRVPFGDLRSMWSSETSSEASGSQHDSKQCPNPSTAHASTSLHPVYPTSTVAPSIPSSLFSSTSNSNSKPSSTASALGYRRQAADLMAQIRKDMTTGKRLVSLETVKDKTMDEVDDKECSTPLQVCVTPASPSSAQVVPPEKSAAQSSNSQPPAPPLSQPSVDTERQKLHLTRTVRKPSPRKLLRRLSAADEVDRELAMNQSNSDPYFPVSPTTGNPHTQPAEQQPIDAKYFPESSLSPTSSSQQASSRPQTHPQSQSTQALHAALHVPMPTQTNSLIPQPTTEPGRVVSGGTASSVETADSVLTRGTTATSTTSVITGRTASTASVVSAPSFVKHAGPIQMTRIGPEDVPSLPEMVGGMRFDRQLMRWVKVGPTKEPGVLRESKGSVGPSEESEDPFRSFESLESGQVGDLADAQPPAVTDDAQAGVDDANDDHESRDDILAAAVTAMSLHDDDTDDSLEFDYDSAGALVEVMTGIDSYDETTDSESDQARPGEGLAEEGNAEDDTATIPPRNTVVTISPNPVTLPEPCSTPIPAHRTGLAAPPRSALKNRNDSLHRRAPGSAIRTPSRLFSSAHRRSVSFSDGRKDGKIKGLGRDTGDEMSVLGPSSDLSSPSARGKRIAAMLENLAEPSGEDPTPSRASVSLRPSTGMGQAQPHTNASSRRPFARSNGEKALSLAQGNQTFLTECSFGVAHDRLVQVIEDVHPYLPHWEKLDRINLSKKGLESVARLKELLPRLDALSLDGNALLWLTGVPKMMRTLSVACNRLTAMTSFNHLMNLEKLDISNNQIESLQQLSCLKRLRELNADGNAITSLDGLGELDGLTKVSLRNNRITQVDCSELHWPRVELLNLSGNRLGGIAGLSCLASLSALNLDHNSLVSLDADGPMPRLRTLRVSNNRLARLDASRFTHIRTLYADNNQLCGVDGARKLHKLENLSLRNQNGTGLTLSTTDIRDVKRLYLSGNPLSWSFLQEPCYNLVYLELAACRLTQLPHEACRLLPNVRVLNLNYNFLTDARALDGLSRLRKLTLIGSRLKGTKPLIRMLRRMPDMEMLDLRMNPCTLGWYLPVLVQDVPGALQPSEAARSGRDVKGEPGGAAHGGPAPRYRGDAWQELDVKFRRDLPDEAYVGRLAYRGLVMRACPKVRLLDGVLVEGREREKAERLLQGVLCAQPRERRT
ncbi:hypothetical protein JB92DRAFT_3013454 [Gautieria morchelliformis]|nr:hypothetical protein JB92DRAFT_3013454 [Gautieria morchelliformis]